MIFFNPNTKNVWLLVGDCLIDMTGGITVDSALVAEKVGRAVAVYQHNTRLDELVKYTNDRRKVAIKLAK